MTDAMANGYRLVDRTDFTTHYYGRGDLLAWLSLRSITGAAWSCY